MVWGYLEREVFYKRQVYKRLCINIFLTRYRQIYEKIYITMFAEFEKFSYPYVISISARLHKPSHLLLWNLLNKGSSTNSASSSSVQI